MSAPNNYSKIGIFVLGAAGLFLAGLFAFGLRAHLEPYMEFETYIKGSVEGLVVGSPVKLSGVKVGKVTLLDFVNNEYPGSQSESVLVRFQIEKRKFIHSEKEIREKLPKLIESGLRARVTSQGITGNSFISLSFLNPARNPIQPIKWKPRCTEIPSSPSQISQMLEALDRVLGKLEKLDLEDIGRNMGGLAAELRQTNQSLQGTLDSVDRARVRDTLQNLSEATANLNEVMLSLKNYPSRFILGNPPSPTQSIPPSTTKE